MAVNRKNDELQIRLALCEQRLDIILSKLSEIEKNINQLKRFMNIGIGIWKSVFAACAVMGSFYGYIILFYN